MEIKGKLGGITIGDNIKTRIMGVINLSPASFFKGSIKQSKKEIISQLLNMVESKADFIDIGAISSAPAFLYNQQENLSEHEEIMRLSKFFAIYKEIGPNIDISVDTQSSKVANYALANGATIINDISGFKADKILPRIISDYDASAIIMSCKKRPGDVFLVPDILRELEKSINLGNNAGITPYKIVIDPGLGGWVSERDAKDDFMIINQLQEFRKLNHCILVGISRKSFIGKILSVSPEQILPPEKRLWGSLAATTIAVLKGAHIVRTHDVQATREVCIISDYMKKLDEK
ncbi:MAG: dihydropteroate synthase [Candidatus Hodarchaeota archaeon]